MPESTGQNRRNVDSAASLSHEEALDAINALRCNLIGTQAASWSNLAYPLVAILNAAGLEYGGAGG